ncbi:MAG: LacI family DNA-binding transcriptional regulator, partial [Pontiella sp.]
MATIYDVAKAAQVSASTVSRIINGERNVAPATAAQVEAAIAKVGYVRRAVRPGRKPVKRQGIQTGMIDFLSLGSHSPAEMFSLPAFSSLLDGIMREVESQGMDLVLSHCPHGKIIPPVLARRRADGILIFGNPGLFKKIEPAVDRVPAVWCFLTDFQGEFPTSHVLYDNAPVGKIAAEYLLKRGHKQLAFMNATASHTAFAERRISYVQSLETAGINPSIIESTMIPPYPDMAIRSQPLIDQLLALDPKPTGVFCVSDDLMLAVDNGLRQRGIIPGRDIELIGCNNDSVRMEQMHPRPATIDLKLERVGRQAVKRLLFEISNPNENDLSRTYIKPELIP